MLKIKNRDQADSRIMISGLVIMLICLFACIIHISDLYSSFKSQINREFVRETKASADHVEAIVGEKNSYLTSVSNELAAALTDGVDEDTIADILGKYDSKGFVYLAYLHKAGGVYDSDGEWNTDIFRTIQDTIAIFKRPYIELSTEVIDENGNNTLRYVIPVYKGADICGHVVAYYKYTGWFEKSEYSYVRSRGAVYLTDLEGVFYATEEEALFVKGEHKNLFEALYQNSDFTAKSNTHITDIKKGMQHDRSEQNSYIDHVGKKVVMVLEPITNSDDIFMVCCYCEDDQVEAVKPTILRSVIVCILIVLLMICLIIYVWASAKQSNMVIERLAYEDNITEGKNTNFFRDKALQIIATNREIPFIAQRFDIVNFRYINEAYGHTRADEILKACIDLKEKFYDEKELCVRMDSDQFLMLSINDSSVDQKRSDYMEAVNEFARSIGVKYPIRLKFGVYQVRKQDLDIDLIIDRANVARKSLDGDETKLIAYYSDALVQNMRKVDKIESEMTKALESGEFKVFLQAKWDIVENKLAGAEALARWIRSDGTMIFPNQFIPVFEKNGFIEKLDFYMLESICRLMGNRAKEGKKICPISINQSRLLLHNPEYVNNVSKVISAHSTPTECIELELTETVFLDDRNRMIEIIKQLRSLNLKLSMDDFGSGYSSLNLLKDIPLDVLKIDREFFSEMITSETSIIILQKIIEMAEGLGMEVLCEGVETEEQIETLKRLKCRIVQGYYYSKPIPLEEFIEKYLT